MEEVQLGNCKPIKSGMNEPLISHLMFIDDFLLFVETSIKEM